MNIPRFSAEASLYKTDNRYAQSAYGGVLIDGSTTVVPQGDCGAWKFFGCIFAVGVCTTGCVVAGPAFPICLGLCLGAAGSIGCIACAGLSSQDEVAATQAALSRPGGGGGGGSPTPRPIGCEVGEKCCERAPNGDCLLCLPRTASCL